MPDEDAAPTDVPTTSSPRDCPLCGQPVTTVTIRGPATAAAAPCGCRMPPEVLLIDPNRIGDDEDADEDGATDYDSGRDAG